jgi:hypothetical protein
LITVYAVIFIQESPRGKDESRDSRHPRQNAIVSGYLAGPRTARGVILIRVILGVPRGMFSSEFHEKQQGTVDFKLIFTSYVCS